MTMWRLSKSKTAAILLVMFVFCTGCSSYAFDSEAVSGSYGEQSGETPDQAQDFSLMVNAEVTVDKTTGRANVMLGNPAENSRLCRVTLVLDETGEILYTTPVLHPGERIAYAELDITAFQNDETKEYPATAFIDIVNQETGETIGTVQAGVLLVLGDL